MDLSRTQHNQEIGNETLESILICTKQPQQDKSSKLPRPHATQAQKCPRCESTNTKFCYYNNYSLTQPRYFCKSCRRYWTQGGTLRNVPVGGSFRKSSKRSSKASKNTGQLEVHHPPLLQTHLNMIPSLTYDSNQDHDLALAAFSNMPMSFDDHDHHHHHQVNVGNYHLESAMDMQNLYYGDDQLMGIGSGGGLNMVDQEIVGIPLSGMGENRTAHNRVLWGFPWKFAVEEHNDNNMNLVGDYDQRGMITTTIWNGVLNSPHM